VVGFVQFPNQATIHPLSPYTHSHTIHKTATRTHQPTLVDSHSSDQSAEITQLGSAPLSSTESPNQFGLSGPSRSPVTQPRGPTNLSEMSIFSPTSHSSRTASSPAYALPTRLPSRVNTALLIPTNSQSATPTQLRSRTTTSSSSNASPSAPRPNRSQIAARDPTSVGTPASALQRRSTYQQPLGTGGSVRRGEGTGRALKRSIGCDVVMDMSRRHESCKPHTRLRSPQPRARAGAPPNLGPVQSGADPAPQTLTGLYDFVQTLGTPIEPPLAPDSKRRAQTPRPGTPAREPRLDLAAVRQNLRELHETERSYLRKMQAMLEASRSSFPQPRLAGAPAYTRTRANVCLPLPPFATAPRPAAAHVC